MIDWDDVRYFLAVARGGSVRAAAERLGVNHSTVLRRVAQLEARLDARVFERLPSGYRMTGAGREILEIAERMEESSHQLEARILGRDQSASGLLRVTLPRTIASHLLAADFAAFGRENPEIELEILASDEPVNLTTRDADVAIRVVYDPGTLPLNLRAAQGPELFSAVYGSRELLAARRGGGPARVRWIVKNNVGIPEWALGGEIAVDGTPFRVTDAETQLVALRSGLGLTTLSCFIGDADPLLARAPGTATHRNGRLWLLTRAEVRRTKRVRLFAEFVSGRLAAYEPLLAGRCARVA